MIGIHKDKKAESVPEKQNKNRHINIASTNPLADTEFKQKKKGKKGAHKE